METDVLHTNLAHSAAIRRERNAKTLVFVASSACLQLASLPVINAHCVVVILADRRKESANVQVHTESIILCIPCADTCVSTNVRIANMVRLTQTCQLQLE